MIEQDVNGLNKKIGYNLLPEQEMRKLGFTDFREGYWHYSQTLHHGTARGDFDDDISFNVSFPKAGTERLRLDVLDEAFCQPYDYQRYLEDDPTHKFALGVREKVEKEMQKLSEANVLTGYEKGMYI